jgi:hypothetical protein
VLGRCRDFVGGQAATLFWKEERMAEVNVDRIKAQVAAARAARPRQPPLLPGIGRWTPTPLKPNPEAAQAHARRLAQAAKVRRGLVQGATAGTGRADRALPLVPPADIVQPAFIWATPAGILVQDNLAPDDNWAQVEFKGGADKQGWCVVGFFYIWTNPTQDALGLSVDTLLGLIGFCSVFAKRSFTGGYAYLGGTAGLDVYEADVLSVAQAEVVQMDVYSFPLWFRPQSKSAIVDALIDLSYDQLVVPGGGTIVVEAWASFYYHTFHDGEVVVDFAGDFSRVANPNMTFTPKPIIMNLIGWRGAGPVDAP